jgi:hypothetical protein
VFVAAYGAVARLALIGLATAGMYSAGSRQHHRRDALAHVHGRLSGNADGWLVSGFP